MKKIAVIFPGIGYHSDKPLLYYSRMLAREAGYEIREVPYKNFPPRIRGSEEKMRQALNIAGDQAEALLSDLDFASFDRILFISKSIGTAVAVHYAASHGLQAFQLMYTPLAETFLLAGEDGLESLDGIAFHGNADPWADTRTLIDLAKDWKIPLYITEGGNHSLETGSTLTDLKALLTVMEISEASIN